MTIPSRQEAQKLFADIAAKLDVCDLQQGKEPQTSRIHFQNVASCAYKIATKISHLDEEKAYILGLLHDYGQLEETLDKNKFHGTAGYDLMMQKGYPGDATVTVCHSRTKNLAEICRNADIIIAALGKPEFLKEDMVKEGAVVIDVGTTRVADPTTKTGFRLKGDVDFEHVAPKCSYITPVPGGVGPMTIVSLLRNTLQAAHNRKA